jgi:site-specific recombinase XerD
LGLLAFLGLVFLDTRSIQDYLGHKAIQHTVRYTELSPVKFKDFWRD